MKLPSTRMILFNAAGVVVGVGVLVGPLRPLFLTPTPTPCSQRYQHSMSFQLVRGGVTLSAADLQSSLGGRDLGVIDNLSITSEKNGPVPISMSVRLPKGAASPLSAADRKGGMSFPREPRSLARASAACVSYDVWLPADFPRRSLARSHRRRRRWPGKFCRAHPLASRRWWCGVLAHPQLR